MTIQDQILEVFNKRDINIWMSRRKVWQDAVALAKASGRSIPLETSIGSKLNRYSREETLLRRKITHPGSTKEVTEYALLSKMTCKDCKKPQDDAAPDMMLRACGCCMAVWHPRCHKGKVKAAQSGDLWFCSDRCAEEMAQNQKRSHAEDEEDEEDAPQRRSARKRKSAVPADITTQHSAPSPPGRSPSARKRNESAGTVLPDDVEYEVRSRTLSLPWRLSSACCIWSILHPSASGESRQ